MVNRPKADINTNLGALLVNNTNGDIEADELLQQFRDMLDSYPNINGIGAGRVPLVTNVDGVAAGSSIRETASQVMIDKSAMIPGGSLDIESIRVSNAGRQVLVTDLINDQMYDLASRPFSENSGSSNPTIDNRVASTTIAFQDRTNQTLNNSVLEATFINATTSTIYEWNSSAFASASGNFYIQIYEGSDATGDVYWQSHDQSQIDSSNVFTLNGGNTVHDCRVIPGRVVDIPRRSHPLNLFANQMYFARFVAVGANFNVQGTTITQADVDNPSSIFSVVGQEVPFFQTRFQAFTQDRIVLDTDITDFGSGQVITTAERNKLAGITGIFRGNYSTTATYAHGDIVRSNYQGRPAMFISAAAQLPDTTLPEAKLDTGFWFLVSDRTWRGAWVASDYIAGQMVTHGGELWAALTIIGVGDTNPPSSTNTSWAQISRTEITTPVEGGDPRAITSIEAGTNVTLGGTGSTLTISSSGGGTGTGPSFEFRRQNTTLGQDTADNTHVIVDQTGTALITITMPDADGTFIDRRITVVNARAAGTTRIAFASGDTLVDAFNNYIDLLPGEAATVATAVNNNWVTVYRGETEVTPSFPSNPQNDDNTFFSSVNGDTSTTWNRDRNTVIDLRADNLTTPTSELNYELANPSTSGITVNDGDGYIFRRTSGATGEVQVFPFSPSNQFFIGSNEYTASSPYQLPLNNSLVVIYDSSAGRWEGRVFEFLVPVGAGGSGGAGGSSGGSAMGDPESSGVYVNESGVALEAGDGVHFDGLGGNRAVTKASIGSDALLHGILLDDTGTDESGTVARFGSVPFPKISPSTDGAVFIGAPLANETRLFWNEGPIGGKGFASLESNAGGTGTEHYQVGRVITSDWVHPTTNFSSNQIIDTQGEWDSGRDKTWVKTVTTALDFEIPDIAEGSAEVSVKAGQQIVIHIPSGNGDVGIRPRGASTIAPKSGSGTTYTNANPYPLSGASSDQYVVIEVNSDGNNWIYYPANKGGIDTRAFFNPEDYNARLSADGLYELSNKVQTNTDDIDNLENDIVIPVTAANYTASIQNVMYVVNPTSHTSNTITIAGTSNWNVQANRIVRIRIRNSSNQYYLKVAKGTGFNEFEGTSVDELWMPPGATWEVLIWNDGSWHIEKPGEIAYDFVYENGVFTGTGSPTWAVPTGQPPLPTQIIEVPSANQDRITVKFDAVIMNLRIDTQFQFSGTAAADFASLATLSPSFNVRKNTTNVAALHDTALVNLSGSKSHVSQEVSIFPINADEYINMTGTDFTDINAVTTVIRGSMVVKAS